ncbi:MAG: hypothetical protein AB7U83_20395 [Vicinamibacterales bacterium]
MPITSRMRVLFRVAAGPRIGFGHLVRCRSLARALGVTPVVAIRGSATTRIRAARLGWRVASARPAAPTLAARRPAVLVIDDPRAAASSSWVRAATRRGIPVVSVHDLGLAPVPSQISIDGSVGPTAACGTVARLRGPRFAVLDPAIAARRRQRPRRRRPASPTVLVALGGGSQAWRVMTPLVRALAAANPLLDIRVAAGFTAPPHRRLPAGRLIATPAGLAEELDRAGVAIVAGGVTAYEACALGVPAVAAAVVPAQRRTVAALARAGAVVEGGRCRTAGDARRLASAALRLLDDDVRCRHLSVRGRRLVDGLGAWRVAAAVRRMAHAA